MGSLALLAIEANKSGTAGHLTTVQKFNLWRASRKVTLVTFVFCSFTTANCEAVHYFQHYRNETAEFTKKVMFRPQKHLEVEEKVQCFDGCRVWEGVIWNVATDVAGVRLYQIKFDEVQDSTVSIFKIGRVPVVNDDEYIRLEGYRL